MRRNLLCVSLLCLALAAPAVAAESIGLELSWTAPLGSGYSGIAVADGRAVTMFAEGDGDWIAAFDVESGERVWTHRIAAIQVGVDGADDGPLSTPVIHDGRVYALGAKGQLLALRMRDGKQLWSRQVDEEFGAVAPPFGFTTTPLVEQGVVILQNGGAEGRAIVGLDAKKGKLRWSYGDDSVRYQSPAVMTLAGRRQVVAVSNEAIVGLDAKKGKLLWRHEFEEGVRAGSANPSFAGDDRFVVFLNGDVTAFRLAAQGDEYELEKLYTSNALGKSYAPPVYHEGHLYGYRANILNCVDAATGERVWRSRPPGGDGLLLADDHLVLFGAEGQIAVAAATPSGYQEIAKIQALEESSLTWPAFASGRIFVRSLKQLAAVAVSAD